MPLHFQPRKPQIDLPDERRRTSVRLANAPTLPDGRSMFDAPTLDLDELLMLGPQENTMPPTDTEMTQQKNMSHRRNGISSALITGTNTLFESGDLMAKLEEMVGQEMPVHEELELPEIPPLPNWERNDSAAHEKTGSEKHVDSGDVATTAHADTAPRAVWPNVRPKSPPVYRKKVQPEKSLELLLPKFSRHYFTLQEIDPSPEPPLRPKGNELLMCAGLTKSYYKKKLKIPVLKGVDFYVEPGEFVSIVGQSGSGKSTLLHLLGTLDKPESGTIHVEGQRVDNLSASKKDYLRNRSIGFIFQFYHLLPELTMLENVLSPLMIRESALSYFFKRKQFTEKAKQLLDSVGLSHRLKHRPSELSGGEMQRAAIARALISEPKILLADEPTGNLDAVSAKEVIELLRQLKDQWNLTIVMVTHDNQIAQTADRVVRMFDGVIVTET